MRVKINQLKEERKARAKHAEAARIKRGMEASERLASSTMKSIETYDKTIKKGGTPKAA